jgi:hypothetical protein
MGYPTGTATLVALADDTTSPYTSSGGGFHPAVACQAEAASSSGRSAIRDGCTPRLLRYSAQCTG